VPPLALRDSHLKSADSTIQQWFAVRKQAFSDTSQISDLPENVKSAIVALSIHSLTIWLVEPNILDLVGFGQGVECANFHSKMREVSHDVIGRISIYRIRYVSANRKSH
jgi:hypothetical protein